MVTTIRTTTVKDNYSTYNYRIKNVTEYNRQGLPIKSIDVTSNIDAFGKDSSVTIFFYQDTLLSKIEWKEFVKHKLVDRGYEIYSYTFDDLERKVSQSITDQDGRQTKKQYIWNAANFIDTVLHYSNDTAIYVPERRGYDHLIGKTLQLKKVVVNTWTANGTLSNSKECEISCRYGYINKPDLCCRMTEYSYNKDTAIQKIRFYNEGWQSVTEKEYSLPSGALYEESQRGDKAITFYLRNKVGLLTKTESNEIEIEGRLRQTITTYEYKFYRN